MKILVLSDDFPPLASGGAGMIAFRLSKEFVRQGHKIVVISSVQNVKDAGEYQVAGMKIYRLFVNYHERWRSYLSLWNPKVIWKIRKIIIDEAPDVVHAHNVHAYLTYYSLILAKRLVGKVFMTAHDIMSFYPGTFTEFIDPKCHLCPESFVYRVNFFMLMKKFRFRYNPLRNFVVRFILKRVTRVIAVSEELADALYQNNISNVLVIYNGIDLVDWKCSNVEAEKFKQSFSLDASKIVLFQGRLSGAKGGELILQAMEKIVKKVPSAKLLIIGKKDAYAKKMIDRARSLCIESDIVLSGWLEETEIKKAYGAAHVVTIPSVCFDSFPNGNLEAFANHKPVVVTCFGGSREIVHDGKNGYVVNPFNVEELSSRIELLLLDDGKAREFGDAGHSLVLKSHTIEKIFKEYMSLFFTDSRKIS